MMDKTNAKIAIIGLGYVGLPLALSYRHGEEELALTEYALNQAFKVYSQAFKEGTEKYLKGAVIKPVFRKFN